ncbi:hypothetical protein G7Y89_g11352 [Cudoniella acicularis]|uniref:Major facilitator superfamily (MFS) profile domain-containing protein n=1 Tax=Cudoniella acicularis TaxID=354080 RepID=A0A8H4RDU9_9HELO|nr:hypothetical protein G7Y89_g11352 [Cudoniella acicularis]
MWRLKNLESESLTLAYGNNPPPFPFPDISVRYSFLGLLTWIIHSHGRYFGTGYRFWKDVLSGRPYLESTHDLKQIGFIPGRNNSQHSRTEEPKGGQDSHLLDVTIERRRSNSTYSVSSFGFDEEVPQPLQDLVDTPQKQPVDRAVATRQQISRQGSFRSLWRSKNKNRNEHRLYESFPRPPSRVLLHLTKVFPEMPQHKQPAYIGKSLPRPPYHVFDTTKKKRTLYMVAIVGVLTPLSTFIYFPALGAILREFHLNAELVLLTITIHMAVQGIATLIWMPLCDYFGRRLTLIATLTIFEGANAGLLFSNGFVSLMLLRAVQALGSAHLSTIGAAVIGDISTGEERGRLIGVFGSLLMFGHVISPVLGGVLVQFFGFRSIFWFQLALGGIALSLVVLYLPETLREIAGNGTIILKPYQQPLFAAIESSPDARFNSNPGTITLKPTITSFIEPLHWLSHMNVLGSILFGAIAFATSVVVISTTALFLESYYRLSTILVGVAFLPSGAGSVLSFFLISYLLEHDYEIFESRYKIEHNIKEDSNLSFKNNSDFPIERARLRNIWWITLLFIGATVGYGFSLSSQHIAIPLLLQFFTAFGATAILLLNGVLIADLCPENSASATAVVNLARFCMGALAVGVMQLIFDRVGAGFTFLIFAMAALAVTPILVLQWMFGVKWRIKERNEGESRTTMDRVKALWEKDLFRRKVARVEQYKGESENQEFLFRWQETIE